MPHWQDVLFKLKHKSTTTTTPPTITKRKPESKTAAAAAVAAGNSFQRKRYCDDDYAAAAAAAACICYKFMETIVCHLISDNKWWCKIDLNKNSDATWANWTVSCI